MIVGTRPEAIKLAPVIKAPRESGDDILVRVVTSGQHCEICRSALAMFGLPRTVNWTSNRSAGHWRILLLTCCGPLAGALPTAGPTSFYPGLHNPRARRVLRADTYCACGSRTAQWRPCPSLPGRGQSPDHRRGFPDPVATDS